MCLNGSVISIISPSSRGSPGLKPHSFHFILPLCWYRSSILLNKWSTPSKYNSHLYNHVLLLISLLYFHYVTFVNLSPFYLYNHRVYKVSPELSRKRRSHPLNIILPAQYTFQTFLIFLIILSGPNCIFIIPIPWFYLLLRTLSLCPLSHSHDRNLRH